MYDYKEAMRADIKEYIAQEINTKEFTRDELEEHLNDILFDCDAVTGNASGSYTFNTYKAQEYVAEDGTQYIQDMVEDFGISAAEIGEHFLNSDWEWFDVSIRCYLLGQMISKVLDDMESAGKLTFAE